LFTKKAKIKKKFVKNLSTRFENKYFTFGYVIYEEISNKIIVAGVYRFKRGVQIEEFGMTENTGWIASHWPSLVPEIWTHAPPTSLNESLDKNVGEGVNRLQKLESTPRTTPKPAPKQDKKKKKKGKKAKKPKETSSEDEGKRQEEEDHDEVVKPKAESKEDDEEVEIEDEDLFDGATSIDELVTKANKKDKRVKKVKNITHTYTRREEESEQTDEEYEKRKGNKKGGKVILDA